MTLISSYLYNREPDDINFKILNDFLSACQPLPQISFWGSRVITVGRGQIELDTLSSKILDAAKIRSKNADYLTPQERIAGIELTKKLNHFYTLTDQELKNSNWFVRILNWIREFNFFMPYTDRWHVEETLEGKFTGYTQTNLKSLEFGKIGATDLQ